VERARRWTTPPRRCAAAPLRRWQRLHWQQLAMTRGSMTS
jgi:hypothetical protein